MNSTRSNKSTQTKAFRKLRYLSPLHKANRQTSVYLQGQLADLGVSAPEAHLLAYVGAYGPCAVGELVRVFGAKKPTMTSILDRLSERKLVKRELHPSDRRSFLVSATPKGVRLGEIARERVEQLEAEIAKHVTRRDVDGFERVIDAIGAVTGIVLRNNVPNKAGNGSTRRRKRNGS
jgi:DNA-binding MarR family transcriptional regulator